VVVRSMNASFFALLVTLGILIPVTRSIHVVVLFVLALALAGMMRWFVSELEAVQKENAMAKEQISKSERSDTSECAKTK